MSNIYKMKNGVYCDLSKIVQVSEIYDEFSGHFNHYFHVYYQLFEKATCIHITIEDKRENESIALARYPYEKIEKIGHFRTDVDLKRDHLEKKFDYSSIKQIRDDLIRAWKENTDCK